MLSRIFLRLSFVLLVCFSASTWANDPLVDPLPGFDEVMPETLAVDGGGIPEGTLDGPLESDLAYQMFYQLLGDPVPLATKYLTNDHSATAITGEPKITLLTYLMAIMASLGLVLSLLFSFYFIGLGTLESINSGQLFGKKWDAVTVSSRIGVSFLGNIPFPGFGGLSGFQVLQLWAILLGLGIAAVLLSVGSEFMLTKPATVVNRPDAPKFVAKLLESKLCVEQMKVSGDDDGDPQFDQIQYRTREWRVSEQQGIFKYHIFAIGGLDGKCGKLEYVVRSRLYDDETWTVLDDSFTEAQNVILPELNTILNSAWRELDAVVNMGSRPLHQYRRFEDIPASDVVRMTQEMTNILNRVTSRVDSILSQLADVEESQWANTVDEFKSSIQRLGVAYTGTLHYALLQRSSLVSGVLEGLLSVGNFTYPDDFDEDVMDALNRVNKIAKKISATWVESAMFDHRGLSDLVIDTALDPTNFSVEKVSQSVSISLGNRILSLFDDNAHNIDPLLTVQNIGDGLLKLGVTATVLTSNISGVTKGVSESGAKFFGAGAIEGFAMPLITMLMSASYSLFALGIFYSTLLVAIPYLVFQTSFIGYTSYCLAAMFGAPFWTAMHGHPDGDGLFGRGGTGYAVLLTLILRPGLLVIGMFAGMALLRGLGYIVKITLQPAMSAVHANSWVIFPVIGLLLVGGIAYLIAIYKSYSLTHELPNIIFQLTGLSGVHAEMGEQAAVDKALAAGGATSAVVSQGMSAAAMRNRPAPHGGGEESPTSQQSDQQPQRRTTDPRDHDPWSD